MLADVCEISPSHHIVAHLRRDDVIGSIIVCLFSAAFSLEGSEISFADLFRLVAFYCISR